MTEDTKTVPAPVVVSSPRHPVCSTCWYFDLGVLPALETDTNPMGKCRKLPPGAVVFGQPSVFAATDWCGEHTEPER